MRDPTGMVRCPGISNRGELIPLVKEQKEGGVSPELDKPKIWKKAPMGVDPTEKYSHSQTPSWWRLDALFSLFSPFPKLL